MSGVLGIKVGMSQVFTASGERVPVTLISTDGCVVVQKKTQEKDGYTAVQLGLGAKSQRDVTKAAKKHFEKAGSQVLRWTREIRVGDPEKFEVGKAVDLEFLKPGDIIKVSGVTKGKGFSGGMKRYNFSGGPGGHGSRFHRRLGSIGNNTNPHKVFKGRPMPGRHGNYRRTQRTVEVIDVLKEDQLVVVRGSIAGAKQGLLEIRKA